MVEEKMSEKLRVNRRPQQFPCDFPDCPDYTKIEKGMRCLYWDFWDGCKLKRVFGRRKKEKT